MTNRHHTAMPHNNIPTTTNTQTHVHTQPTTCQQLHSADTNQPTPYMAIIINDLHIHLHTTMNITSSHCTAQCMATAHIPHQPHNNTNENHTHIKYHNTVAHNSSNEHCQPQPHTTTTPATPTTTPQQQHAHQPTGRPDHTNATLSHRQSHTQQQLKNHAHAQPRLTHTHTTHIPCPHRSHNTHTHTTHTSHTTRTPRTRHTTHITHTAAAAPHQKTTIKPVNTHQHTTPHNASQ